MSKKFDKIKYYYDYGLWTIRQVRDAVIKNRITAEEFAIITGQDYEEDNA